MSKIGEEINELLLELEKEYKIETLEPGDVTAKDMSEVTGLGVRQCASILSEKASKGELISKKLKNGQLAYRKVVE